LRLHHSILFINDSFELLFKISFNCRLEMNDNNAQETKSLFKRLPQTIVPTHYDLTIQPYLDKFKFNGDVNIHLKVCCNIVFLFSF